ncbi:MAG TPA: AbrB/MazE/SpoVT family DNA-binding domain-containing protein [Burkholderiaceae bacterium]|jgi:antitoxin MazE|nr:AbrB/MazE/SpoVT family DNA-binding domain-containing protein [Burkholderiaceae bacterium]
MQVELLKWGNSSAVRLPEAVLKEVQVALGDRLELRTEGGKIILERTRRGYRLEDLLSGITKENRHGLVNFGAPSGR